MNQWRAWVWAWAVLVAALGCVAEPEPTLDPDRVDGAVQDASALDGGAAPDGRPGLDAGPKVDGGGAEDAEATDATSPGDAAAMDAALAMDGAAPDAEAPDQALVDGDVGDGGPGLDDGLAADAGLDAQPSPDLAPAPDGGAEPDDGPAADVGPDEGPEVDLGPDAAVPTAFVVGRARAMDGRIPVRVTAQGAEAVTDRANRYRVGPLFEGPVTLRFTAPGHQSETVEVRVRAGGDLVLDELVELYRGQRIGTGAGRIDFDFGEAFVVWNLGDRLIARPTAGADAVELLAEGYEVFLGFQPGDGAAVVRVRTMPGIAGDIFRVPLDGAQPPQRLFVEAQPWVRWLGDGRALGMVHTRDALSRLEVVTPGEPAEAVAEGVPWLLVSTLVDGQVAFAAGEGPEFGVFLTDLDGLEPRRLDGDGPTSDAFLTTTPGRSGLMWLTPDGVLWRWEPEVGAEPQADGVLASPRPRFLPDGRLLFWRADGDLEALWILDPDDERRLVDAADGGTLTPLGEGLFVVRPDQGLWWQPYDAEGELAVPGAVQTYRVSAGGALALVEGVVWRYRPGAGASPVEGPGPLSVLSNTVGGATAWEAETRSLWWIPQPGADRPPVVIAEGAPSPSVRNARGGDAAFVRDAEGWAWVPLPPGDDARERVAYGAQVDRLVDLVDAGRMLTQNDEGTLYAVDVATGEAVGWAREVGLVRRSSRSSFVAYTCDRGLFLVPFDE